MELSAFIQKIQECLRAGKYVNEAAISVQVLLPLLRQLGWPDDDPETVRPEYSVGGQRVDYALFNQRTKPVIFIEVKKPGRIMGGEAQLFEYAYKQGIPMAILTDGQEWFFYLPCEQGEISERCVYKLDILERAVTESVHRFRRYIEYRQVCDGQAFEDAKADYQDKAKNRDMKKTLPKAWKKILEDQDSILVDLLAETVEDLCGYKPDPDITGSFIKSQLYPSAAVHPKSTTISKPKSENGTQIQPKPTRKRSGEYNYVLYGQEYPTNNTARGVMIAVLEKLQENDSGFIERFKSRKHGRKRRYVALTPLELYPGNPDLAQDSTHFRKLSTGDYVGTNYGKKSIQDIIKLAAEVAGVKFGTDLIISLGEEDI
jgi:hypothetical protein